MPLAAHDRWNRAVGFLLLLFAAALPHSIAAAQTVAGLAFVVWLLGRVVRRRPLDSTPLDVPILLFLLVTGLAAAFSLDPAVSVTKLRGATLILLVPLVAGSVATRRQAATLVAVLLGSACASAAYVDWQKLAGQGVDVVALEPGSPLRPRVQARDVIVTCDGRPIRSPAQFNRLLAEHNPSTPLRCQGFRGGVYPFHFRVPPERWRQPVSPEAWGYQVRRGRSLRARGTYSHFVTYAEVMMLLTALALGLWLAYPGKRAARGLALLLPVLLLGAALAATFTRASWAGLALAGLAMVFVRVGWRARLAALVAAVVALVGLNALLVHWRGVGFYNPADLSTQYRWMMWEDGLRLVRQHPWLGIGMDSVINRWQELGLRAYEKFGLHGHFHSTPVQLAVERGLLGLGAWLLLMGLYVRLLFRLLLRTQGAERWWVQGLVLGTFGATLSFLASGLAHYNFGDSEVVMVFWLLAGVALALDRLVRAQPLRPA